MRKLCVILLALILAVGICAAAAEENAAKIRIPEGTEIPEDLENPDDPVELGAWEIPFARPGDDHWYIYAHTEDGVLLGLALYRPEDPDAEYVTLPDGVEMIIPGFFEQMPNIKRVRIPKSVRTLSMQCFAGVHRDFVIECEPGSYAERFALEYGFQYDNGEKKAIGWQISDPEEKVKWVVANYIREDMSEREKARAMHNWIITNSHYWSDGDSPESRESNMLLSEGWGVCEAYSFVYYRLLKEAGMAVAWFTGGTEPGETANHMWNLVRIDGQWLHVDCTWDDPTNGPPDKPCVSGQERELYFLKTDGEMSADHYWEDEYSADRGRMFSFWDPEAGREMMRDSWDADFGYMPNEE